MDRHGRAGRARKGAVPLLWAAAALVLVAGAAAVADAEATPVDDRLLYVFVSDDGLRATAFDRIGLRVDAPPSLSLEAPERGDVRSVTDQDGTQLQWARGGAGHVEVARGTATAIVIVSEVRSDRPGALDLRFPGGSSAGAFAIVASLPDDIRPGGGLSAVAAGSELERAVRDAGFPVADGRSLWGDAEASVGDTAAMRFAVPTENAGLSFAILIGLFVVLGACTVWLFARIHRGLDDPTVARRTMGFLAHLDELRRRLGIVAIVLFTVAAFFFTFQFRWWSLYGFAIPVPWPSMFENAAAQVYGHLARLVVPPGVQVIVTRPMDAAAMQMWVSVALGIMVTFPILLYQLYSFLAPGLYPRERRAVFTSVPFVLVLFVGGAIFGIYGMAPFMFDILYLYAGGIQAVPFLDAQELVTFTILFGVVFGIAFQLPAVMVLLVRIGIARTYTYIKYWRHMVVVITFVAALVTDPTVLSQLIVAAVLLVLYAVGLLLSYVVEKRRMNTVASSQAEGED